MTRDGESMSSLVSLQQGFFDCNSEEVDFDLEVNKFCHYENYCFLRRPTEAEKNSILVRLQEE